MFPKSSDGKIQYFEFQAMPYIQIFTIIILLLPGSRYCICNKRRKQSTTKAPKNTHYPTKLIGKAVPDLRGLEKEKENGSASMRNMVILWNLKNVSLPANCMKSTLVCN